MPTNITDVDDFTDPVQAPIDGEAATGASVQLPTQGNANRTRYLFNKLNGIGADANEPQFKTTALSTDHPADPANVWNFIHDIETGWEAGVNIRMYSGNNDNSTGLFCITENARWSADDQEWISDDNGEPSRIWTMGPGAIAYMFKGPTAFPWADVDWETIATGAGDADLRIAGEFRYTGAKSVLRKLNLLSGSFGDNGSGGVTWAPSLGGTGGTRFGLQTIADNAVAYWPIELPSGTVIKAVFALVKPGDTTGVMSIGLQRSSGANFSPPTEPGTLVTVGTTNSNGTANLQTISVGSLTEQIDQSPSGGNEYALRVGGSSNGGTVADFVFLVGVLIEDLGLRNG